VIHADNSLPDAVSELTSSKKFRAWKPEPPPPTKSTKSDIEKSALMKDKHYSPDKLAELWGVSAETIRSIFRDEPGVLKIGKTGAKYQRGYVTLRIPESVAERVHMRLSA
jgi:hypothetical protein